MQTLRQASRPKAGGVAVRFSWCRKRMKSCSAAAFRAISSVASVEPSLTIIQATGFTVWATTVSMTPGKKRASL